ncbi:MAG: metallophosphoesterase [Candidatus Paceibacterota bacterium]
MANKYYIGDLHIGHSAMAKKRGFASHEDMFEYMKEKWNAKVNKNDVVYVMGDVVMERRRFIKKLAELKGKKIIVLGNHDRPQDTEEYLKYAIKVTAMVKYKSMFFTHCPIHPMELDYRVKLNVHSHTHEKSVMKKLFGLFSVKDDRYICVSCEHIDYEPKSLEELGINI